MSSSEHPLPVGSAFTKTLHRETCPAISPSRPELSQAGRTILITGGHTGIGLSIARSFAQANAKGVIIIGRRANVVASATAQLSAAFPLTRFSGHAVDLILAAVQALWEGFHRDNILVDIVVLNAAKLSASPILTLGRDAVWDEYLVHVRSGLDFAERLYKQLGAEGRAKAIVNLASVAIHDNTNTGPFPGYAAGKSAGTILMQVIAKNVSPEDLQIVSYHPGGVFTELALTSGFSKDDPRWDDEKLPGDFAVWAASPEARFAHGRFLWAKWDVNELREAAVRERLEKDDTFLKVGVVGIREWELRSEPRV